MARASRTCRGGENVWNPNDIWWLYISLTYLRREFNVWMYLCPTPNVTNCSLHHVRAILKISWNSVHRFFVTLRPNTDSQEKGKDPGFQVMANECMPLIEGCSRRESQPKMNQIVVFLVIREVKYSMNYTLVIENIVFDEKPYIILKLCPYSTFSIKISWTTRNALVREWCNHACGDQSRYAPCEWDTSLQCNDLSHWLCSCLDWSLYFALFLVDLLCSLGYFDSSISAGLKWIRQDGVLGTELITWLPWCHWSDSGEYGWNRLVSNFHKYSKARRVLIILLVNCCKHAEINHI